MGASKYELRRKISNVNKRIDDLDDEIRALRRRREQLLEEYEIRKHERNRMEDFFMVQREKISRLRTCGLNNIAIKAADYQEDLFGKAKFDKFENYFEYAMKAVLNEIDHVDMKILTAEKNIGSLEREIKGYKKSIQKIEEEEENG